MCGIIGVTDVMIEAKQVRAAATIMSGRGPDAISVEKVGPSTFLGFTLLGLSSQKTNLLIQPFISEQRHLCVCVNGEIYNHAELRKDLESKGFKFKSESDGEVVLHGLDHYGISFLSDLRGEFAIVAFYPEQMKWICAVDHVGTKPLKYYYNKNSFAVASTVEALRTIGIPIHLNSTAILFSLSNVVGPNQDSIFKNIHTISPGHYIEYQESMGLRINSYKCAIRNSGKENLEQLLTSAIRERVPKYFPIALALSSGIDSSLLALLMKRMEIPFKPFSITFVGSVYSEQTEIKKFGDKHSLNPHYVSISPGKLREAFKDSVLFAEAILINPHAAAKLILNREIVKQGYRACFTGDGADELFFGYDHFFTSDDFQFVRDSQFIGAQHISLLDEKYRQEFLNQNLYTDSRHSLKNPSAQGLYYHYWFNQYGLKILGDSQASTVGLEFRYPFVDNDLINRFIDEPHFREKNYPSKSVLRELVARYDEEQALVKKRPFIAPLIDGEWFPLFEEYVFNKKFEKIEFLNFHQVRDYIWRLKKSNPYEKTSSIVLTQILSLAILNHHLT